LNPTADSNAINSSILIGLGLGLVLDGKLYQGSRGLIEGGHIIVDNYSHGRNCSCGQVGCVEAYSSAKSTSVRMFEADVVRERERAKMRRSFSDDPDKVTGIFHLIFFSACIVFRRANTSSMLAP
jgi:predicted NBD/HSP70 family sugar kinase